MDREVHHVEFRMEDKTGHSRVEGRVSGHSEIPGFDDLKFEGVLALLNSIDQINFTSQGQKEKFNQYIKEIEATVDQMVKHETFQGKTN